MKEITTRRFDDMHVHFRNGQMMKAVVPITAEYCGRAVVMPNTNPPILNADDVLRYYRAIQEEINTHSGLPDFEPLMTIKIRDDTTPHTIEGAYSVGAVAGKVYPRGVTTNSEDGLTSFDNDNIIKVFEKMEELGMLLLLHGEVDEKEVLVTEREAVFLPVLEGIARRFPDLKIVLEHISSREGVMTVKELPDNVAGTITAHHLCMTLNDVIGNKIRPHNVCMPTPKGFDDLDTLLCAATSENRKFFLGSDAAPHPKSSKECAEGACGVFTSPILPALLTEIFERNDALDKLEDFTSRFGAEFYGLPRNEGKITLVKKSWTVPEEIDGIVPFMAGRTLHWKLV